MKKEKTNIKIEGIGYLAILLIILLISSTVYFYYRFVSVQDSTLSYAFLGLERTGSILEQKYKPEMSEIEAAEILKEYTLNSSFYYKEIEQVSEGFFLYEKFNTESIRFALSSGLDRNVDGKYHKKTIENILDFTKQLKSVSNDLTNDYGFYGDNKNIADKVKALSKALS